MNLNLHPGELSRHQIMAELRKHAIVGILVDEGTHATQLDDMVRYDLRGTGFGLKTRWVIVGDDGEILWQSSPKNGQRRQAERTHERLAFRVYELVPPVRTDRFQMDDIESV